MTRRINLPELPSDMTDCEHPWQWKLVVYRGRRIKYNGNIGTKSNPKSGPAVMYQWGTAELSDGGTAHPGKVTWFFNGHKRTDKNITNAVVGGVYWVCEDTAGTTRTQGEFAPKYVCRIRTDETAAWQGCDLAAMDFGRVAASARREQSRNLLKEHLEPLREAMQVMGGRERRIMMVRVMEYLM